jgi:hypothetical protein
MHKLDLLAVVLYRRATNVERDRAGERSDAVVPSVASERVVRGQGCHKFGLTKLEYRLVNEFIFNALGLGAWIGLSISQARLKMWA